METHVPVAADSKATPYTKSKKKRGKYPRDVEKFGKQRKKHQIRFNRCGEGRGEC
jgi:hypothetical protein